MSKKVMLLALVVTSVTMFALPAAASAQEIHLEGITSFSGTGGAASLTAESEPVITCESVHMEGTVNPGGTTGAISLDYTGCHSTFLGATIKCRTSGSPLDNTVKSSGTFHLITTSDGPAILTTPVVTTMVCAGITNTITGGNIIGTITSPSCGAESKSMTTKFGATGAAQDHTLYTGTTYNLTAKTGEGGTVRKAGLVNTATVSSATTGKLNCT